VSKPRSDRWHVGTPAFFGGVPIYAAVLMGSAVCVPAFNRFAWTLVVLSSLIFLLGLLDDLLRLAPAPKLLAQIVLAIAAVNCGLVQKALDLPLLSLGFSLLWIVGITNAFNLLDNIDGLCAGTAVIASFFLIILCLAGGAHDCAIVMSVAAGSMAGFLLFNFHPARIFMGDSGSLFIGFLIAMGSLLQTPRLSRALVITPIILLAVPILDTLLVSVSRRLRGQPITQGGTDHTSHRLVRLGMTESSAVLLLYAITALSGGLALVTWRLTYSRALAASCVWFFLLLLFGIQLFKSRSGARIKPTAQNVRLTPKGEPVQSRWRIFKLIAPADSGEPSR
jgi:UDP-GlcNAc:undecaprenyl-phosphate GlcNAc-1-phosphate transferase